jgi:hypothetical protein
MSRYELWYAFNVSCKLLHLTCELSRLHTPLICTHLNFSLLSPFSEETSVLPTWLPRARAFSH